MELGKIDLIVTDSRKRKTSTETCGEHVAGRVFEFDDEYGTRKSILLFELGGDGEILGPRCAGDIDNLNRLREC